MGVKVAHNLTSNSIVDYIELSPDYSILEIEAIPRWFDKSLEDLRLRNKYQVTVMAVKRGEEVNVSPGPKYKIQKGDILVALGASEAINKIAEEAGE
jgi:trk system potassium uptake protein TrkA